MATAAPFSSHPSNGAENSAFPTLASTASAMGETALHATGVGRFAPSPSGDLHLGNLRTALLAWLWARTTGRKFVLRIEDIDRVRSGSTQRQIDELTALGIDWDGEVLIQSSRAHVHDEAVTRLFHEGYAFECFCSRKDIREASSAPHVPPGHYPGTCLHLSEAEISRRREEFAAEGRRPALRLKAPVAEWTVHDEYFGDYTGPVDHFVIQRSDGAPAYNLAVVVDDAFQGVDQVVRGDDLLSQSPGQAVLARLLGYPEVTYVHVPLVLSASGARLAKRDGAVTIEELAEQGVSIAQIIEVLARSMGVEGVHSASQLLESMDVERLRALPQEPWTPDLERLFPRK